MLSRRQALGGALAAGSLFPLNPSPFVLTASAAARSPLLGAIRAVTITTDNLTAATNAWVGYMNYHMVSQGKIPRNVALSWDAPALEGRNYVILGPASGERTYLRFVEQATPKGYSSEEALGWRTTEITVQNSDQLYERLKNSPFKVTHPPRVIPTYPYLRAMQAEGPSGERLNLTWIMEKRVDIPVAQSFVGRCFIAVLASADLRGTLKFYQDLFGNDAGPIRDVPLVPRIELSTILLKNSSKIEVDQFPPDAKPNPRPDGGLPPGLAIVTFDCKTPASLAGKFVGPPINIGSEPYYGQKAATMRGPSGELLELIDN